MPPSSGVTNGVEEIIEVDKSEFVQFRPMKTVVLVVGGSATFLPGTTVFIRCDVSRQHGMFFSPVERFYQRSQLQVDEHLLDRFCVAISVQ